MIGKSDRWWDTNLASHKQSEDKLKPQCYNSIEKIYKVSDQNSKMKLLFTKLGINIQKI